MIKTEKETRMYRFCRNHGRQFRRIWTWRLGTYKAAPDKRSESNTHSDHSFSQYRWFQLFWAEKQIYYVRFYGLEEGHRKGESYDCTDKVLHLKPVQSQVQDTVLCSFKLACDTNDMHRDVSIWLLNLFMEISASIALNARLNSLH